MTAFVSAASFAEPYRYSQFYATQKKVWLEGNLLLFNLLRSQPSFYPLCLQAATSQCTLVFSQTVWVFSFSLPCDLMARLLLRPVNAWFISQRTSMLLLRSFSLLLYTQGMFLEEWQPMRTIAKSFLYIRGGRKFLIWLRFLFIGPHVFLLLDLLWVVPAVSPVFSWYISECQNIWQLQCVIV